MKLSLKEVLAKLLTHISEMENAVVSGQFTRSTGNINANTSYSILKLTIPRGGRYLLYGEALALSGDISLNLKYVRNGAETSFASSWGGSMPTVIKSYILKKNDEVILYLTASTSQTFYADSRNQILEAIWLAS